MLVFPNCKINIGLRITAKRSDGFHNLETVFVPVPWCDALEIIESPDLTITLTGLQIPGATETNLCTKAWHLLKTDFPDLPPVAIHLHKTIPTGAGLGGGSSNGAFMIRLLNEKFGLGLTREKMMEYALHLGSDCPFFILNEPMLARGRGEIMEPVPLDLSGYYLVLVYPGIHVSTAWAFSQLQPTLPDTSLNDLVALPIQNWKHAGITNDFEAPVFSKYPEIEAIKNTMLSQGALFAAMSGSGSTCFGIFEKEPGLKQDSFEGKYPVKIIAF